MQNKNAREERIVSIEIYVDPTGISTEELDRLTRHLASELRQLPHKSIGTIAAQAPATVESTKNATQGSIAVTLQSNTLPRVLGLLRSVSLREGRHNIKLKGPGDIELDLTSSTADEAEGTWLNAAMRGSIAANSIAAAEREPAPLSSTQEMRERARHHIERG